MSDKRYFTGSHNPFNIFKSAAYDIAFMKANPDYFAPDGVWVFCGSQGSGKTISATQTLLSLAADYPKAIICSNLNVYGLDREIIPFVDYEQISNLKNGIEGVIFLIDEMQVLWNCMEARNIPITEIGTLCQNRKDRRVIIGTSQVYGRIAKPIREQFKYVILCQKVFRYIQINTVIDPASGGYTSEDSGHFEGEVIKKSIWFHSPAAYKAYDTYNKIERIQRKKEVKIL